MDRAPSTTLPHRKPSLPRTLAVLLALVVSASLVGFDPPAQERTRGAAAKPALPPYVVIPEDRPWESAAFAKRRLEFRFSKAGADSQRVAIDAAQRGLIRHERGSVLLFHSPGRARLAEQVAELFARQHRLLAWMTGQGFSSIPVVIIGSDESSPAFEMPFWVDVDGYGAWRLITGETELPLKAKGGFLADVARSWLYHGTLHECCHHGTCFDLRLMPYRWFCEGLSDYVAATAAVCYSGELDAAHVGEWLTKLEALEELPETIDVLSGDVWWAPGGGRRQDDIETAAYAASQYSIARLVAEHGHGWIAKSLARFEKRSPSDADELLRVLQEESGAKGLRERLQAVPMDQVLAYLRLGR
jgi:hypothetical protein